MANNLAEQLGCFLLDSSRIAKAISPEVVCAIKIMNKWQEESRGKTPLPYGTPNLLYF